MNNIIPLQNSPERVSLLPIAPGVDFATALSLRRMATSTGATPAYLLAPEVSALLFYMPDQRHHMLFATLWNTGMRIGEARMLTPDSTGATPAYLLAPEVSALLFYMPDQRHHMLFATLWNTGMRIGEARMLTPESFDLDGVRPFVRILSEKVRARRGRPPKDEVRLVPLTDISYVRQMESWMITTRPRRRAPLWAVTDETMRNWLKQAVKRAEADGVHFSIPVTPHTFRHSYIMHMLYHRQPRKVIQALAGHRDPRSMEVYTRVFALDMAATLVVPFTGDGRDAAEILRTQPPLK